jgi:Ca-activated chloride channel family protein
MFGLNLSFAHPIALVLLVAPILLLRWVWRRPGGRVVLPFDHGRQSPGMGWATLINLAESVPALLLTVAILLIAGPQRLGEPKTRRILTNIEFCVDISGSMTAKLGEGSRYDASMAAIDEFLDFREGDDFGLTFFGNNVLHWVPLTSDTSAIRCAPPFMRPEIAPPWFGGTEIGRALMACKRILEDREEGDRMIVLVSDGFSFDLGNGNDLKVAADLKEANIVLYAVHIADTAIPDEIVNVTRLTGGEVFEPGDPEGVKAVFRRIDAMQPARLEKTAAESADHFVPFCVAGLSMLGVFGLASFGVRYTPW